MTKLKIDDKVKWHDIAINDYPQEDRAEALNRICSIVEVNNSPNGILDDDEDILIIASECGTIAEVYVDELVLV